MALLFIDGFDHEALLPPSARVQGRRPSSGAIRLRLGTRGYLKTLDDPQTDLIVGAAFRVGADALDEPVLMGMGEASDQVAHLLKIGGDERLKLYRVQGGYASLVCTSNATAPAGGWHTVELRVSQGSNDGILSVRLNGQVAIHLVAQDTLLQAGSLITCFLGALPGQYCPASIDVDDLYIANTSGDIHNTFLGDVRVDTSVARVPGHWVGGGPSRQSFEAEPLRLSNPGAVAGVQVSVHASKTDPRWNTIRSRVVGGTQTFTGPASQIQSSPTWHRTMFERPPNGQAHWSPSAFNAAQFGVEVA